MRRAKPKRLILTLPLDGKTLISANGTFEVGFFRPIGNSRGRYLGMWYRNLSPLTVVWVANRETPLRNNSGILKLNANGLLVILNGANCKRHYLVV